MGLKCYWCVAAGTGAQGQSFRPAAARAPRWRFAAASQPANATRRYYVYYMVSFAIFLTAGVLGLLLLAGVSSQCVKVCPLVAPDGTPCNLKEGVCLKGDAAGCVDKGSMYQHQDSDALKRDFNNQCFVCINGDVYWPNAKSSGTLKWVPAGGCETLEDFGGQDPDSEELCWSVPPEMGMRGLTVPLLWLTAILYLLQAVGTLVCSMGMKHFATCVRRTRTVSRPAYAPPTGDWSPSTGHSNRKYSQDWKKLTTNEVRLGLMVKVFPRVNRVLNLGVMLLLFVLLLMMFGLRVCVRVGTRSGK